jgi:hypothetical protein
MADKSKKNPHTSPASLRKLAAQYKSVAAQAAKSEESRLRLARQMIEHAMRTEGSRIRTVEHNLSRPGSKPKIVDLAFTDPRAAALRLDCFCNLRFPLPFWICVTQCPIFIPFPVPPLIRFGWFLVFCDFNACNLAVTCYYIPI